MRTYQHQYRRASAYGLSLAGQLALFESQGGRCRACEVPIEFDTGHLDHCHATGRIRGFLCRSCNVALGLVSDSADRLRALASYLEGHANLEPDYVPARATRTRCRHDHELTDDNIYVDSRGYRTCLTCRRISGRRYAARKRVAV